VSAPAAAGQGAPPRRALVALDAVHGRLTLAPLAPDGCLLASPAPFASLPAALAALAGAEAARRGDEERRKRKRSSVVPLPAELGADAMTPTGVCSGGEPVRGGAPSAHADAPAAPAPPNNAGAPRRHRALAAWRLPGCTPMVAWSGTRVTGLRALPRQACLLSCCQ